MIVPGNLSSLLALLIGIFIGVIIGGYYGWKKGYFLATHIVVLSAAVAGFVLPNFGMLGSILIGALVGFLVAYIYEQITDNSLGTEAKYLMIIGAVSVILFRFLRLFLIPFLLFAPSVIYVYVGIISGLLIGIIAGITISD